MRHGPSLTPKIVEHHAKSRGGLLYARSAFCRCDVSDEPALLAGEGKAKRRESTLQHLEH